MTKEALGEGETILFQEKSETTRSENHKENIQSEDRVRFQKQQVANLEVKEAMARELTEMELDLPDYVVNEILKIEDDPPF
jgi:hypothetical protein